MANASTDTLTSDDQPNDNDANEKLSQGFGWSFLGSSIQKLASSYGRRVGGQRKVELSTDDYDIEVMCDDTRDDGPTEKMFVQFNKITIKDRETDGKTTDVFIELDNNRYPNPGLRQIRAKLGDESLSVTDQDALHPHQVSKFPKDLTEVAFKKNTELMKQIAQLARDVYPALEQEIDIKKNTADYNRAISMVRARPETRKISGLTRTRILWTLSAGLAGMGGHDVEEDAANPSKLTGMNASDLCRRVGEPYALYGEDTARQDYVFEHEGLKIKIMEPLKYSGYANGTSYPESETVTISVFEPGTEESILSMEYRYADPYVPKPDLCRIYYAEEHGNSVSDKNPWNAIVRELSQQDGKVDELKSLLGKINAGIEHEMEQVNKAEN